MNIIARFEQGIMTVHALAENAVAQYIERPAHRVKMLFLDAEGEIEKVLHWGKDVEGGFQVAEHDADATADADIKGATDKLDALKDEIGGKEAEIEPNATTVAAIDAARRGEVEPVTLDELRTQAPNEPEPDNYDVTPKNTSAPKTVDESGDTAGHDEPVTGFAALARKEEELAKDHPAGE